MQVTEADCKTCIQLLRDRAEDGHTRVAAAESLMHCNTEAAKAALFAVTIDDGEPKYLREEAAGSLGTLWAESEIDYSRLIQIPLPYLDEVITDFDFHGVCLDKTQLSDQRPVFEQRYEHRQFMSDSEQ